MIAMQEVYNNMYYKCVNAYYDTEYNIGQWKTYFQDLFAGYFSPSTTMVRNPKFNFKHNILYSDVSWTHLVCGEQDFLELMSDHINTPASSLLDIMLRTSYYRDKGNIYYSLYYDTREVPCILVFCILDDTCLFFYDLGEDVDFKTDFIYITQRKVIQLLSCDTFHMVVSKTEKKWQDKLRDNGYVNHSNITENDILFVKLR